jgi:hypothetical protein
MCWECDLLGRVVAMFEKFFARQQFVWVDHRFEFEHLGRPIAGVV